MSGNQAAGLKHRSLLRWIVGLCLGLSALVQPAGPASAGSLVSRDPVGDARRGLDIRSVTVRHDVGGDGRLTVQLKFASLKRDSWNRLLVFIDTNSDGRDDFRLAVQSWGQSLLFTGGGNGDYVCTVPTRVNYNKLQIVSRIDLGCLGKPAAVRVAVAISGGTIFNPSSDEVPYTRRVLAG